MNTRQAAILDLLHQDERISVRALAARFAVSEMTIRRDLSGLEAQGLLVRTHGGGVATGKFRFLERAFPNYAVSPQKAAIGALAATLVQPGQTVIIDTGTTALEVARNLPQNAGVTVATTSLCAAQELYGSALNVLLLGGVLRKEFPSLYGPMTEAMLAQLHVDVLFIGCDGAVSSEGFFTSDLHLSSLEQAMIRCASRSVVVTESRKFGRRAFVRYAAPNAVHVLVTDDGLSAADRERLEAQGITILIAKTE